MTEVYDTDILNWSEQQSALLRRLAAGERINDLIDWPNVIEEIESVGRSELKAVQSHIVLALLHELKAQAWPHSLAVEHWQDEALSHRVNAGQHFEPEMRPRIDIATLYQDALRAMPKTIDGKPPLPFPRECPFSLDDLLS
ncbi:MAG: DUF29 domain-containing protein [Acetobacteraceae bacterium]